MDEGEGKGGAWDGLWRKNSEAQVNNDIFQRERKKKVGRDMRGEEERNKNKR